MQATRPRARACIFHKTLALILYISITYIHACVECYNYNCTMVEPKIKGFSHSLYHISTTALTTAIMMVVYICLYYGDYIHS